MADLIWLVTRFKLRPDVKAPWRGTLPPPGAIAGTAAEEAEVAAAFGEAKGGSGEFLRPFPMVGARRGVITESRRPEQLHFQSDVVVLLWHCRCVVLLWCGFILGLIVVENEIAQGRR